MNVGINFTALDDERLRQEHLLREVQSIEDELNSSGLGHSKLPQMASLVGVSRSNFKSIDFRISF